MPNTLCTRKIAWLTVACLLSCGFLSPNEAVGQLDGMRFELGRRLTRFERAWQTADDQARIASLESMDGAVRSFFGLQLETAVQLLDQACQEVTNPSPEALQKWLDVNRFSIDFEVPWIDATKPALRLRWRQVVQPQRRTASSGQSTVLQSAVLGKGVLRLEVLDEKRQVVATESWVGFLPDATEATESEDWHEWRLPELPPGDYQVAATYEVDGSSIGMISEWISISHNLDDRLQKASEWYEGHRRSSGDTTIATAKWLVREMKQGYKGQATEIDIPWNAWLTHFELLRDSGAGFFEAMLRTGPTSLWVQLSHSRKTQIVRLGIPRPSSEPMPVLFAFHGAGGSENMFFEAYGAGRLVSLANERGWLVVSPRQTLNGLALDIDTMLESLSEQLPIDRSRVMLVGHSMGASQAMAQVSAHPDEVIAVAALGGGGSAKPSLRSKEIRFYVAAGDRDFGRPRAKSLVESLSKMECDVQYREFPNVEHMVIVQAALDEVFEFLDETSRVANHSNNAGDRK
jgi:predicted esterase